MAPGFIFLVDIVLILGLAFCDRTEGTVPQKRAGSGNEDVIGKKNECVVKSLSSAGDS